MIAYTQYSVSSSATQLRVAHQRPSPISASLSATSVSVRFSLFLSHYYFVSPLLSDFLPHSHRAHFCTKACGVCREKQLYIVQLTPWPWLCVRYAVWRSARTQQLTSAKRNIDWWRRTSSACVLRQCAVGSELNCSFHTLLFDSVCSKAPQAFTTLHCLHQVVVIRRTPRILYLFAFNEGWRRCHAHFWWRKLNIKRITISTIII